MSAARAWTCAVRRAGGSGAFQRVVRAAEAALFCSSYPVELRESQLKLRLLPPGGDISHCLVPDVSELFSPHVCFLTTNTSA